jgi:cytochrome P450
VVSPLHKIPGPWYTAISRIPYNVLLVRGTQLEYVERLHRKYGPVVRLAPDMVSICDPDVAHEIYHTHRFLKGPLYRGFDLTGRPNLFSMRHPNLSEFKLRKRLMAPAFTPSALRGLEPVVNQAGLQPLLRTFDKHAESGDTVNAMDLFMRANLSIMGAIAFGKSFNLIEEYHPILEWLSDILELGVLKSAVGETAAIKLRPKLHRNHQAAIEFARKAISDRRARAEVAADSLQRYLDVYSENDEESPLTEADVVGEMLVQL